MKKLTKLWIKTIALLSLFLSFAFANTQSFILSVLNPKQTAANNPAFDIYLLNTIPILLSPQARSSG